MSACTNQGYSVIATTATTIGVGISQQPTNGALDATLGYKRAEVAFVPTNRNSGDDAGKNGGGARDSANVIMELRYSGIFSTGDGSGIYQRLAVGNIAVTQNGTALLFAKGPDGKVDAGTAAALKAVRELPEVNETVEAAKAKLAKRLGSATASNDSTTVGKFDAAAKAEGFKDFDDFVASDKVTTEQVQAVRKRLESDGIKFDD
jgi:hypothetical protein